MDSPSLLESVWVLVKEGPVGDLNACLGVAQRLTQNPKIIYTSTIEKAGGVRAFIEQLTTESFGFVASRFVNGDSINAILPQAIVTSHHDASPIPYALELKRLAGGKIFLIQLRDPGQAHDAFEVIANPCNVAKIPGPNVIETLGVAHPITKELLEKGRALWQDELSGFSDLPKIAVMIGGSVFKHPDQIGGGIFTIEDAIRFGKDLNKIAQERSAALILTNSSRTPEEAWNALCEQITDAPSYMHDYRQNAAKGNPYFGLLAISDILIPTADSMSMCSEACYTGKPVYIAGVDFSNIRSDHARLVKELIDRGYARPLNRIHEPWHDRPTPLDIAGDIVKEALKKMDLQKACSAR